MTNLNDRTELKVNLLHRSNLTSQLDESDEYIQF